MFMFPFLENIDLPIPPGYDGFGSYFCYCLLPSVVTFWCLLSGGNKFDTTDIKGAYIKECAFSFS